MIRYRIIRNIRTLFEQEDDYYQPKRVSNFRTNNCIEYESNDDRNKNLSLEEYLDKIRTYSRDIIIDALVLHTWKIQLTIEISFISPEDVN